LPPADLVEVGAVQQIEVDMGDAQRQFYRIVVSDAP